MVKAFLDKQGEDWRRGETDVIRDLEKGEECHLDTDVDAVQGRVQCVESSRKINPVLIATSLSFKCSDT